MVVLLAASLCPCGLLAEEPALPAGLDSNPPAGKAKTDEPPLPGGLGEEPKLPGGLGDEPRLPGGLGDEPKLPGGLGEEPKLPGGLDKPAPPRTRPAPTAPKQPARWLDLRSLGLSGFWEVRGGVRTQPDRHEEDASLGETRLQLDWEKTWKKVTFKLVADVLYDQVEDHHSVDLEAGDGFLDLRQANVMFSPLAFLDVKLGRQILTWGTGDLLFVNDLFPKDWRAFFIGRDVEYLKAPSDAVKVSAFSELANVDVVYTPRFDPDRYLRGRRISYYSPAAGGRVGRSAFLSAERPKDWFHDDEWAVRVHRKVGPAQVAAYGYWGYWKSPAGMNPLNGKATFPRLQVYGASVRGQVGKGIGFAEAGYYDSPHDRSGKNPLINNSQVRFLLGYERDLPEIAPDLTVGAQWYFERMVNHGAYRRALPPGSPADSEMRNVMTLRLTKKLLNQNLTVGLFAYYSPTDDDAYLRPNIQYKIDDHWTAELGGNVFFGSRTHTFFGQFSRDTNVYCSLRYGF